MVEVLDFLFFINPSLYSRRKGRKMAEAALELPLASTQRSVKSRLRTYQPHIVADLLSSTQGTSQHEGHRQEVSRARAHLTYDTSDDPAPRSPGGPLLC